MSCAAAVHPGPQVPLEAVVARLGPARIVGDVSGIVVTSVTVARPSLDDVYLRYTGRTFDSAESESAEVKKR